MLVRERGAARSDALARADGVTAAGLGMAEGRAGRSLRRERVIHQRAGGCVCVRREQQRVADRRARWTEVAAARAMEPGARADVGLGDPPLMA